MEDLYRPYKQKRRTRATIAREKGLEPLAALLFAQERDCPRPEDAAAGFIDSEKCVETAADALQGANDIIAEWSSDDAAVRKSLLLKPLRRRKHERKLRQIAAARLRKFRRHDLQTSDRKARSEIKHRRNPQFFTYCAKFRSCKLCGFRRHQTAIFKSSRRTSCRQNDNIPGNQLFRKFYRKDIMSSRRQV